MTQKIAIFTQSYLSHIPSDVDEEQFVFALSNEIEKLIEEKFSQVAWQSTRFGIYDPKVDNIGQCQHCGAWTSDRNKQNFVAEISVGAVVDGQLCCDLCLPSDHDLAF